MHFLVELQRSKGYLIINLLLHLSSVAITLIYFKDWLVSSCLVVAYVASFTYSVYCYHSNRLLKITVLPNQTLILHTTGLGKVEVERFKVLFRNRFCLVVTWYLNERRVTHLLTQDSCQAYEFKQIDFWLRWGSPQKID